MNNLKNFVTRWKKSIGSMSVMGDMILTLEISLATDEELNNAKHQVTKSRMSEEMKIRAMEFIQTNRDKPMSPRP